MSRRPPATQLQRGEEVVVDLTAPTRSFVIPLIEAAAWTAGAWLLIGLVDRPDVAVDPLLRGAIVVAWLGVLAARVTASAVLRAVLAAKGLNAPGLPSVPATSELG